MPEYLHLLVLLDEHILKYNKRNIISVINSVTENKQKIICT